MSLGIGKQVWPTGTYIVGQGHSWQVINSSGQAGLQAVPSTVAALVLWNGEKRDLLTGLASNSYIVDSIAVTRLLADTTTISNLTLWAMLNKTPIGGVTAPTDDAAMTIRSLCGRGVSYTGLAKKAQNQSVTNDGWFPWGNSTTVSSAIAGTAWVTQDVNIDGRLIIPPGGMLSVAATMVSATASALAFTIRWHEAVIPGLPLDKG